MASHQVVAFKWSGSGYNTTYNTSHTAVLNDDDGAYQGSGDGDETVSIDGGAAISTTGNPYSITCRFDAADGTSHVEPFNFFNAGGDWYFIPGPNSAFGVGATLGSYQSHTIGWDYDSVVCFANGTHIMTANGERLVEDLAPGDLVQTLDGGCRPLRLNMARSLSEQAVKGNARLRPVKIAAGALGDGLPRSDLRVSRQHRMLVSSKIAHRMFGTTDVLIPAIRLTELPGCTLDEECLSVCYHHLVFDRHEIVFANGSPSESFYPGPEALKSIPREAKTELMEIFPALNIATPKTEHVRLVPPGRLQKKLVTRHLKNSRPLVQASATQ